MGGDEDEFWRSLLAFDYKMCFFFFWGGGTLLYEICLYHIVFQWRFRGN